MLASEDTAQGGWEGAGVDLRTTGLTRSTHPPSLCLPQACSRHLPGQPALPVETIPASPVDAGVTVALVDLGQARGVMVALGAAAGEARDAILTGTPIVAGAACTLINVDVAHAPCGWGGAQIPGLPPRAHSSRS